MKNHRYKILDVFGIDEYKVGDIVDFYNGSFCNTEYIAVNRQNDDGCYRIERFNVIFNPFKHKPFGGYSSAFCIRGVRQLITSEYVNVFIEVEIKD